MNAKEYLRQAEELDATIETKLETVAALRSLLEKSTGVLSALPKSQGDGRSLENTIAKIVDLEEEIDNDIAKLFLIKTNIVKMISSLKNPTQRNVMEKRYVQGKSWAEIAAETGRGKTTLYNIQTAAIKELDKNFLNTQ